MIGALSFRPEPCRRGRSPGRLRHLPRRRSGGSFARAQRGGCNCTILSQIVPECNILWQNGTGLFFSILLPLWPEIR
mgnify:CR=1 FL=1